MALPRPGFSLIFIRIFYKLVSTPQTLPTIAIPNMVSANALLQKPLVHHHHIVQKIAVQVIHSTIVFI